MTRRFLPPPATKLLWTSGLGLVLLCLAAMMGCQGFSSAKSSSQQQLGILALSGSTLDFGSVTSGQSKTITLTASNTGTASVTVSSASLSSKNSSPSATFTVTFAPLAAGSASGSVTITSDASNPSLSLPLSGTGVTQAAVGANPTSLDFGTVTVGNKQALSETLTNTGGSTLIVSQ